MCSEITRQAAVSPVNCLLNEKPRAVKNSTEVGRFATGMFTKIFEGIVFFRQSAAGDGSHNEKGIAAVGDGGGERGVGRFVGQVFRAGEKADKGAALS